ncbi:TRAP transporter substrate-binding protein [Azospirillum sp. TSO35-2]|uniref:TRAP transporter substrate-binding protein n=1 Tax=Azospirillum sp. TSO35-2 TaxID=716796 RepID=UPI000D61296B|nr:TRAP transporter substrate-binding protein [Azospirillum sp. TSO35-2]PWC36494.1 C4-dicarboxylate ABC transporter [Azospirillum sp. TSO35-2]
MKTVQAVTLGLLAMLGGIAPALAQDKPVNLKMSTWVPPTHPLQASIQAWINDITKESKGTITGTIYPAEQLGKAFDHYDMVRDGIADFAYISPGYQPGRFPIIAAGQIPFTFADGTAGTAALDAWYRKYAAREMKDVKVCMSFLHDPGTLHSRKKIVVPEDMKGLKVRPAHGTMGEFVTLLGGTNVKASAPEARDILERGVADAISFPWQSVILFGIDKVVKYHLDVPLYSTSYVWAMNKDVYDGMSVAQKKVIDDHCTTDWAVKFAGPWADFEAGGRAKMRAMPDHEVVPVTPDQLAQWKKAAAPLQKNWADAVRKTGANPDTVWAELQASLTRYKGGL